jgi:hypothetical protein
MENIILRKVSISTPSPSPSPPGARERKDERIEFVGWVEERNPTTDCKGFLVNFVDRRHGQLLQAGMDGGLGIF